MGACGSAPVYHRPHHARTVPTAPTMPAQPIPWEAVIIHSILRPIRTMRHESLLLEHSTWASRQEDLLRGNITDEASTAYIIRNNERLSRSTKMLAWCTMVLMKRYPDNAYIQSLFSSLPTSTVINLTSMVELINDERFSLDVRTNVLNGSAMINDTFQTVTMTSIMPAAREHFTSLTVMAQLYWLRLVDSSNDMALVTELADKLTCSMELYKNMVLRLIARRAERDYSHAMLMRAVLTAERGAALADALIVYYAGIPEKLFLDTVTQLQTYKSGSDIIPPSWITSDRMSVTIPNAAEEAGYLKLSRNRLYNPKFGIGNQVLYKSGSTAYVGIIESVSISFVVAASTRTSAHIKYSIRSSLNLTSRGVPNNLHRVLEKDVERVVT